ncbi:hypothetical protein D3C80_1152740 [compost metagenome]
MSGADRLIAGFKNAKKTVKGSNALRTDRHRFDFLQPQIGGISAPGGIGSYFLQKIIGLGIAVLAK